MPRCITQQELGYRVGLSSQRVNEALKALKALDAAGVMRVEYGRVGVCVRMLDLRRLRHPR